MVEEKLHPPGEKGSRRAGTLLDVSGWLVFFASAAFVVLWLAPHKGVDFADEGWYLQAALNAAQGRGFDSLLPQAPFYLVNAVFMRLGFESYLAQRLLYYALVGLGLYALGAGLSGDRGRGFQTPLAMSAGLFCALTSILSYENGPVVFAGAALGLVLLAAQARSVSVRLFLALLAGFSLSLAVFVNFTIFPAALCCAAFFLLPSGGKSVSRVAFAAFGLCFGVLAWRYLSLIGLGEFLRLPSEKHGFKFEKIPAMLEFALQWLAVFFALFALPFWRSWRRAGGDRAVAALTRLLTPLTCLLFFLLMARRIRGFNPDGPWSPLFSLFSLFHGVGLSWLAAMPDMLQFQLVLFFGFALASLALVGTFERNRPYALYAAVIACIGAFWLIQVFLSESVHSLRSFFAAPLLAAALARISVYDRSRPKTSPVLARGSLLLSCLLAVGCCLMYAASYTHPSATRPMLTTTPLGVPRLAGLLETPERAETLERLIAAYEENGCASKSVFVFKFANILHYIFDKQPPRGLSYILPVRRYPEQRIMDELDAAQGWCVFVSKNFELDAGWEKVGPVLERLERESGKIMRLGHDPKRHVYDDFTVYIGPK